MLERCGAIGGAQSADASARATVPEICKSEVAHAQRGSTHTTAVRDGSVLRRGPLVQRKSAATGGYTRETCIALADAAVADLGEMLPGIGRPTDANKASSGKKVRRTKESADPEAAL